jgi:uncharacterized membrane protein
LVAVQKNALLLIIAILSAVGMLDSVYLTYDHYRLASGATGSVCDINDRFSCSNVNGSPYSAVLGVPTAFLGFVWFLAALMLAWLARRSYLKKSEFYLFLWCALGIMFVAWLVFAEIILIGSICLFCTLVHALVAAMLVVSFLVLEKPRNRYFKRNRSTVPSSSS